MYTLNKYSQPKSNFIQYSLCTCILSTAHYMKSDVVFSTCDILSALKIFDFGAFWIADFQIRNAQSIILGEKFYIILKGINMANIFTKSTEVLAVI